MVGPSHNSHIAARASLSKRLCTGDLAVLMQTKDLPWHHGTAWRSTNGCTRTTNMPTKHCSQLSSLSHPFCPIPSHLVWIVASGGVMIGSARRYDRNSSCKSLFAMEELQRTHSLEDLLRIYCKPKAISASRSLWHVSWEEAFGQWKMPLAEKW